MADDDQSENPERVPDLPRRTPPGEARLRPHVVYLIQDMLFSSKVREAAKASGLSVQAAREPAAFAEAARGAKLAVVDLRLPSAMQALEAVGAGTRTVAFIDHEKTDVMDAARAHGAEVMAKGQFANALPKLFASLK